MPILNLLTIKHALTLGANELKQSDTPELDCELILLYALSAHRNILFTDPDSLLNVEQQKVFIALIARRKKGEPVAYIIGTQGFWDLDLKVSPDTLIPRADTESLVEWVLDQNLKPARILDLGTGTGALALALASEFPNAQVTGLDVMVGAVKLATENQKRNHIINAQFIVSSWFSELDETEPFDLIVSNPPYIDVKDEHLALGDVRFEPESALIADQNGYADLFLIAETAKSFLTAGGFLIMEHGWQQSETVQGKFKELGYSAVGSGKDYGGNQRFTFGVWNN
jgi:release factor glutamine methyltransferase